MSPHGAGGTRPARGVQSVWRRAAGKTAGSGGATANDALMATDPQFSKILYNEAILLCLLKQYRQAVVTLQNILENLETLAEDIAVKACFLLLDVCIHVHRGTDARTVEGAVAASNVERALQFLDKRSTAPAPAEDSAGGSGSSGGSGAAAAKQGSNAGSGADGARAPRMRGPYSSRSSSTISDCIVPSCIWWRLTPRVRRKHQVGSRNLPEAAEGVPVGTYENAAGRGAVVDAQLPTAAPEPLTAERRDRSPHAGAPPQGEPGVRARQLQEEY